VKNERAWRDEFVPKDELKCACGCELQLSKGDLADAIRVIAMFGGKPRVYGVDIKPKVTEERRKLEAEEPVESQPCPGCRIVMVAIPVFAVGLLQHKKSEWPRCPPCKARQEREAQERKEPPRQQSFKARPKLHWREVLGEAMRWPPFGNADLLLLARKRYRDLIQKFHPDRAGGDHERAAELNVAMQEAEAELS
jgi:hypothetical protein